MVIDPSGRSLTRLGRLVGDGTETVSDADLLRRYVADRDGAAFAALVRRHAPMVFGVCRRTLGQVHDAEDAFQAAFLILARKAPAVRPDTIGRWLYGVAVRVANKARVRRARRMAAQRELESVGEPAGLPAPAPLDWLPLLDAALARLSDRDRRPILLCDLMGRSRAEAAAELGIAEGTLSSRLARSREKLRARLARLGAVLSIPTLAAGLADEAGATVPMSVIQSTVAASASAAAARELAEGVLRTMFLAKITKVLAVGACFAGTLAAGIVWLPTAGADPAGGTKETPKGAPPAAERAKPDSDLARIQGTWIIESKKPDESKVGRPGDRGFGDPFGGGWGGRPVTFDGDRVEFSGFPGRTRTFRLDPSGEPKHIDFAFHDVNRGSFRRADVKRPSIYRFDGDRLQIVLGDDELEARPDSFELKDKSTPFIHLVLRRPNDDERRRLEQDEQTSLQGTWVGVLKTTRGESRDASAQLKLVVKGDRLRFDAPPAEPLHATFQMNVDTHPWQIDLTAAADGGGAKKGDKVLGILFRQGELLTIAFGSGGHPPGSFEAAAKQGTVYYLIRDGTSINRWRDVLRPSAANAPAPPAKPGAEPKRIRELQQERVEALKDQVEGALEQVKIGKDPLIQYVDALRELCEAELELAATHEARLAAVEKWLKELRATELLLSQLQEAGLQTKQGVAQAKAARLKAEIQLEKLKLEK